MTSKMPKLNLSKVSSVIGNITIAPGALDGARSWLDNHLIFGLFADTDYYAQGMDARVTSCVALGPNKYTLLVEIGGTSELWDIDNEGNLTGPTGARLNNH